MFKVLILESPMSEEELNIKVGNSYSLLAIVKHNKEYHHYFEYTGNPIMDSLAERELK